MEDIAYVMMENLASRSFNPRWLGHWPVEWTSIPNIPNNNNNNHFKGAVCDIYVTHSPKIIHRFRGIQENQLLSAGRMTISIISENRLFKKLLWTWSKTKQNSAQATHKNCLQVGTQTSRTTQNIKNSYSFWKNF